MTALATDSGRKTPARLASSAILACQSDDRLVKLVRSGHERAFEAIVQRYRKPLVRYCGRILPDSRCEDAVQQAFINAHAALIGSDEPIQLKAWLYAIARNAALNMVRQNGWNYEQIPLDFDGVRCPDQVFEERIELQQTVAAMHDLPERQRSALVMREFEGRSYDEIALALGANDGAVRQLLNRARVTLRSAASLLLPPPLVTRAAASLPPSDGRHLSELVGGLGAAGVAKAGATALVAGSLVVGAVKTPLPLTESHKPTREKATLAPAKPAAAGRPAAHDTPVALDGRTQASQSHRHGERENEGRDSTGRHRSGDDTSERSGSGSGDDSRTRERSGPDDPSPRSGSGGGDDHSGTSGSSGSDDATATLIPSDDHSGTSGGSGTSGTSGSGTSGSGSDDAATSPTGSGTSGSSEALEH